MLDILIIFAIPFLLGVIVGAKFDSWWWRQCAKDRRPKFSNGHWWCVCRSHSEKEEKDDGHD